MNKTPKTEWQQGGDEQRMMIWKVVAYDNFYGIAWPYHAIPMNLRPAIYVYHAWRYGQKCTRNPNLSETGTYNGTDKMRIDRF